MGTEVDEKAGDIITESSLDLTPGITEDDKLLWKKDKQAVEYSLNYAKLWSKFCKELVVTLEKKAAIENDCNRSIVKLYQGLESSLSSNSMVGAPVRSETLNMCKLVTEQLKEMEIQNSKKLGRLLDVINRQRTEFGKTRKLYKEKWKADCKKMIDAENTMFKTRSAYYQRCQQGVKLREELTNAQSLLNQMLDQAAADMANVSSSSTVSTPQSSGLSGPPTFDVNSMSSTGGGTAATNQDQVSASQLGKHKVKVDKLEKQLRDNDKKEIELMYSYKESVEMVNTRLVQYEKKKLEHLCDIRLTTSRSDEIVKDTMAEYIKILSETRLSMLNDFSVLGDKFQEYKPCQEYVNLIEKQCQNKPDNYSEKFQVELFHDSVVAKEKAESQLSRGFSRIGIGLGKESDNKGNRATLASHSDSDSDNAESSNIHGNASGSSAPSQEGGPVKQTATITAGVGVLNTIVEFGSNLFTKGSSNQGNQGAGSHGNSGSVGQSGGGPGGIKKSTSGSTSSMGGGHQGQNSSDEAEWIKEITTAADHVLHCIKAIEKQENGLQTHGIYRVSASKSKVSSIMELLNSTTSHNNELPDLDNEAPITLASTVKSKLIGLSEPLVPYSLYTDFVELGKEAETSDGQPLVNKLKGLVLQIPNTNQKLLGLILHHLKKIANNAEENQMGTSNLGTLFAPTLIKTKPRFRNADIKEYMDNKSQAKIVQVIIENVKELFGDDAQYYDIKYLTELKDNEKESYLVTATNNSIKRTRPHSSIIESSISTINHESSVPANEHQKGNNAMGDNKPSINASTSKETSALKPVDPTSIAPALSPRLRAKKSSAHSLNDEDDVGPTQSSGQPVAASSSASVTSPTLPTSQFTATSSTSASAVSSTNTPAGFKLAQLSQPGSDSVFHKRQVNATTISTVGRSNNPRMHTEIIGDRSIRLKQSFISGTNPSSRTTNPISSSSILSSSTSPYTSSSSVIARQSKTSSTKPYSNYLILDANYDENDDIEINNKRRYTESTSSVESNSPKIVVANETPDIHTVKPRAQSLFLNSPFNRQSNFRQPLIPKHCALSASRQQLSFNFDDDYVNEFHNSDNSKYTIATNSLDHNFYEPIKIKKRNKLKHSFLLTKKFRSLDNLSDICKNDADGNSDNSNASKNRVIQLKKNYNANRIIDAEYFV